ncbi:hypothetical protein GDO86_002446 [Hymenochirus boettgeri]|uniref:Uncharacterized protein n=1 Tax=Hymenochirus boettgeri TaxID=247094 RepID=A0A8T2KKX6_9PIPI|nr:hypothetical protein GDO86_002446 [Hymenochirus boettgeri]
MYNLQEWNHKISNVYPGVSLNTVLLLSVTLTAPDCCSIHSLFPHWRVTTSFLYCTVIFSVHFPFCTALILLMNLLNRCTENIMYGGFATECSMVQ